MQGEKGNYAGDKGWHAPPWSVGTWAVKRASAWEGSSEGQIK